MTLLLDDEMVRSVFDWRDAVGAVRDAYAAPLDAARFPGRTMARGDHGWLRTLSGVPASGWMGVKVIAASPPNGQVSYLISLFEQESGQLVALLDGHSVTGYRTAATSALAADLLARPGALDVAVIGSGFEARNHVRALAAVRPIVAVRVFSPRAKSRAAFVHDLSDLRVPITAVDQPVQAATGADLVICAARSRDESPTLRGQWLEPGMTVVSIGSTLPEQREVDSDVLGRADLIVADELREVMDDSGDLIVARGDGIDVEAKSVALADVVGARCSGRTGDEQIVVYKSVGSALQDLAVAAVCVRSAQRDGVGELLPVGLRPVRK